MTPRRLGAALALAIAASCNPPSPQAGAGEVAGAAAQGMIGGLRAAQDVRAPWRCSQLGRQPPAKDTFKLGPHAWSAEGDTLRTEKEASLTVAVVADARSGAQASNAALAALPASFRRLGVDLLFVAGGFGGSEKELLASLAPIAKGPWVTVVLPGDAEPLPALRSAVAELRGKGAPIIDGSAVRFVESTGVVIATMPGMPYAQRLGGGADGCQYTGDDVSAILGAVAARAGRRATALVSPTAPRAAGVSDVTTSGVHAGDLALRAALIEKPVDVVIHGQPAEMLPNGAVGKGPLWLGAGSIGPEPRFDDRGRRVPAGALVVTLGGGEVRWQAVYPPR